MTNEEIAQIQNDTVAEMFDEMLINSGSYLRVSGDKIILVRPYDDGNKVVKSELHIIAF